MCGRYSIYEPMDHYLKELGSKQLVINGYGLWPIERYNVAPTTRVEIIRPMGDGLSVDKVRWGWSPIEDEPYWRINSLSRPNSISDHLIQTANIRFSGSEMLVPCARTAPKRVTCHLQT